MKNKISMCLALFFSFFLFACFSSEVKAADCGDTVAGLRIKCTSSNSLSGVPSNIRDTVSFYSGIGMNDFEYNGFGYDYNSLSSSVVNPFDDRPIRLPSGQVSTVKKSLQSIAAAEKYLALDWHMDGYDNIPSRVMSINGGVNTDTNNAYIARADVFDVNYFYGFLYNVEKIHRTGGWIGHTIVRGEDAIIFQDKYSTPAYNKGYVYTYCESRFIWCWSRSDYVQKTIYNRTNSKGTYTGGKLYYKDLNSVQMILPSYSIPQEFMDDRPEGKKTINGTTYYNYNFGNVGGTYDYENGFRWSAADQIPGEPYMLGSQTFFSHLVMEYKTKVSFYYKDEAASNSTVVTLRKATAPVTVYVTYEALKEANDWEKVFMALNGFNDDSKLDMDESGITSNVSLIPVQYDMSMILDPSYWSASGFQDTGESITVIAGKVSSYKTKTFANKTIYMNTVGIDEAIEILAMGVFQNDNANTMTLMASGEIYYSYEEIDFIDFSFTYQIGDGAVVDLTPYLTSYLSNSGVCAKCAIPVNGTPVKANKLTVVADAKEDELELKVYGSTSASEIKSYPGSNKFLSASYVSQGGVKHKVEYTTSMSVSKLIVFQVVYYGATYYIPFTFDNTAPNITSFASKNINGKYVVVESEAELKSLNFSGSDDISSTVTQVEDQCLLSNSGSGYKYTLAIRDEAGNVSKATFDVIIDNQAPTSIEGTAILPNGNEPLSSHGDTYMEFQVTSNVELNRSGDAPFNFIDSYLDVSLNSIGTMKDLSTLVPYNAVLVDEGDTFSLDVIVKDYGVYGYTSAGMRGIYVKVWLNTDDETEVGWQYMSHGVYNSIESKYNIPLTSGTNYIAIASLDYMNHIYRQDGSGNNFKFDIKLYAINVYGTPYISEIIATEDGFGAIVRDDLTIFKDSNVVTFITEYVIVDATASDSTFEDFDTSTAAVKTVIDHSSSYNSVLATPINPKLDKKVAKNKSYGNMSDYLVDFDTGPGWISYDNLILSPSVVVALRTKDININNMDNQMVIRGMLLNGQAYIYAHVVVNTSPAPVDMYQRVMFASSYTKSNSPTLELTNSFTEENTGNLDNIFSVSGNDEVSYWDGNNMMIRYNLNMYKQSDPNVRTGDDSQDIYRADNFIIYYKSCYQSEGTFGAATVCAGSTIRYYQGDPINLGKMNSNYLYKVYVGVVTALEYDVGTNKLTERYNNDSGYNVVTFASSKFMVDNDTSMNQTQLVETYYETYYGMFLYDTSIPEVIIEYTTINEYNPDGINKLKDVNYAAELGDMENFIIKVTIKYESDKYRKPAYWTRLDKESIYWFPYYYSTGRSVCGNVDRIDCGYDKAFTTFGLEEALSNSRSTYDPEVGLVYYLQYPTSDDIAKISAAYSVDVFDLIVKLTTTNGLHNDGMDLVVDEIVRKQNEEYLTIYYDQDGPKIVITSSPDKDPTYYAISISAEDVSSNVARVAFYYGKYDVENPDAESFLMYEEVVNAKTFTGYSAQLTQKGWYTVVAEDEFGQLSTFSFEVVQVGDGVMYSPTLDDTDQIQDNDDEAVKVVVTLVASVMSLLVAALVIALIVGLAVIYFKYGKYIKQIDKLKKSKMGQAAIKVAKKSGHPVASGVATAVEKAPTEMFNDEDPKPAESPEESPQDLEEEIPSEGDE